MGDWMWTDKRTIQLKGHLGQDQLHQISKQYEAL